MKRTITALALIAFSSVSCVEVTSGRRRGPGEVPSPEEERVPVKKSKVHVTTFNPFNDIVDVVAYPFKAVGKGLGKIF